MAFYIQSVNSGLYLDVKGESEAAGIEVIVYDFHGKKNQQWRYNNGMIFSKLNKYVLQFSFSLVTSYIQNLLYCRIVSDQELTEIVSYGICSSFSLFKFGYLRTDRQAYLLTHWLFPQCKGCNCSFFSTVVWESRLLCPLYKLCQRFLTCGPRTPGGPRRILRGSATV
jgi:hypothetical protein